MVGAVLEDAYVDMLHNAGLAMEIVGRLDYFAGSASANTRRAAHGLGAHIVVMRGAKR